MKFISYFNIYTFQVLVVYVANDNDAYIYQRIQIVITSVTLTLFFLSTYFSLHTAHSL